MNFYNDLFRSVNPTLANVEDCIRDIRPRVIVEMNEVLQQPFTPKDISEALQQMAPLKSLGLEGFNAFFY